MSQKHLARLLSKLGTFQEPLIDLEQYSTDSDVASELLWSAYMRGFIKEKIILDLGAGTGILGIGALLLGAKKVIFLEKDSSAIISLNSNLDFLKKTYELPECVIINEDLASFNLNNLGIEKTDLVIMHPPFGAKTKKTDSVFLDKAFLFSDVVISLHKTSTKKFVLDYFKKNSFKLIDVFDFRYPFKKTFENHNKPVVFIEVSGFFGEKII